MKIADKIKNTSASMYVIAGLCEALGIARAVNMATDWEEGDTKVSPGHCVVAMVINLLSQWGHMYGVERFFEESDVTALMGSQYSAKDFNDDTMARTTDRIYKAGPGKVYSTVALQAILNEKVPAMFLHGDTSSMYVHGEYGDEAGSSATIRITRGYSKDHRPDLKQVMLGMVVTKDGIPVMADMLSGNTPDSDWNANTLVQLEKWKKLANVDNIVYTADSKLVTKGNLELISGKGIDLLSVLPATFNLNEQLKLKAYSENDVDSWVEIGAIASCQDAAKYRAKSYVDFIGEKQYRFIVVHSNALESKKRETLENQLPKTRKALEKLTEKASKEVYACEPDACSALDKLIQEVHAQGFNLEGKAVKHEVFHYPGKGRPRKGAEPLKKTFWQLDLMLNDPTKESLEHLLKIESTFVLVTTLMDEDKWDIRSLLEEYKGQYVVEQQFRFIKDPAFIKSFYIHTPHRLEAFGYIVMMAAMVASVLQLRVRTSLSSSGEKVMVKGRIKRGNPTVARIIEELSEPMTSLTWYPDKAGPERTWYRLSDNARKVLGHTGIDVTRFYGNCSE